MTSKAAETEASLQRAEKNAAGVLSKWDEDDKYVGMAKTKLARSSEEFIKYRDAQCAFSSSLGGGAAGNARELDRLACVAELNSRRAIQLRDEVSGLPLK